MPPVICTLGEVLRTAPEAPRLDEFDQLVEGSNSRLETFGVERQRRFVLVDIDDALHVDVALVDPVRYCVPGNAVVPLASQESPCRRVQPRMTRQRTVMEVCSTSLCGLPDSGRNKREVGDAEQPIEAVTDQPFGRSRPRCEDFYPIFRCPIANVIAVGHRDADNMSLVDQQRATLDQKRAISNEDTGELRIGGGGLHVGNPEELTSHRLNISNGAKLDDLRSGFG